MPSRDPSLTLAITRHGWMVGHRRYRLARRRLQLRKCGVIVFLLAAVASATYALLWRPEDANNTAQSAVNVECPQCGEAHSLREVDDLCHGANVAPSAARLPTMIDGAFQGAT